MSASNRDEIVQAKPALALKFAVENVLIWLFWGLSDFFGGHGHPLASDILFVLFFSSLMLVLAFIANAAWPHPRIIWVLYGLVCIAFGYFVIAAKWSVVLQNIRSFLPAAASLATAIWGYGVWRAAKRADAVRIVEIKALRDELHTAKQIAESVRRRTAPRQLTEIGRARLKGVLAKYPKHNFWAWAEEYDDEAAFFGKNIRDILRECGWTGECVFLMFTDGAIRSAPGIGITSDPEMVGADLNVEMIKEIYAVLEADGIKTNSKKVYPSLTGMKGKIEFHVGKRPAV